MSAALPLFAPSIKQLRLVLDGPPRTKKTSNRTFDVGKRCGACKRGARTVVMPSEAWCEWCAYAKIKIGFKLPQGWQPIDFPVNCAALFYRDRDIGDSHGFYQGLADVLQESKIVADDKWVRSWDGSRLLKDSARPRVELVLTPIEERG